MIINTVSISENRSNINFTGNIQNTPLYRNYAIQYAKKIKASEPDWSRLRIFINTIRAVKADGTNNELILDTVQTANGRKWLFKYDNYIDNADTFESQKYTPETYSDEKIGREAFIKIVEFGKEYFGLFEVSKPIKEFAQANIHINRASKFHQKAIQAKDRDTSMKLKWKASHEWTKADSSVKEAQLNILNNL